MICVSAEYTTTCVSIFPILYIDFACNRLIGLQRGTYICAHAWIFFELCILITHHIQTTKMYLLNKIIKNKA